MATAETFEGKQSRNGKKPVPLPKGVTFSMEGTTVTLKGSKGEISRTFREEVTIQNAEEGILVRPVEGSGTAGLKFQGTTRALLQNMVVGVHEGYTISLDFRGVGYRAEMNGTTLKITVGLSHQPELEIPKEISVKIDTIDEAGTKYPRVQLTSVDKEMVGQVAARIRSKRPPEPYKGKGIRYTGEKIRMKAGKSGK